jgi:uncharacterized protein YbbC (DUF1343 family)
MKKLLRYGLTKKSSRVGLLCNHTAWRLSARKYSFEVLAGSGQLTKVFLPEHGLFGELQDQEKLDSTTRYRDLFPGIDFVSLYGAGENSLSATEEQLSGIDTLIIDLQDAGSRYYTFISTTWLLLQRITTHQPHIKVIVIDRANPAGRQVEGTRMTPEFASFIGLNGLPHRHGLTLGELVGYFRNKLGARWRLKIVPPREKDQIFIPPSPNIPSPGTCRVYSGQCLWEGTNISEGRGTTLPFELIGSPFMDWIFKENWNHPKHPAFDKHVSLRPVQFIPVFHKYANQPCYGLHLLLYNKKNYHSLAHSIRLLQFIRKNTGEFRWREGSYEAFNDRKAIELLAGDRLILDYFENKSSWKDLQFRMQEEEAAWIREAKPFLLYKPSLQQLKIK